MYSCSGTGLVLMKVQGGFSINNENNILDKNKVNWNFDNNNNIICKYFDYTIPSCVSWEKYITVMRKLNLKNR